MTLKLFLPIILFLFGFIISDKPVEIEHIIYEHSDHIYTDKFDNLYITIQNKLLKYNTNGKLINSYSNKSGEYISRLDIKNPFKLILIFEQQNKLLFLDNNLSEISNELYLDEFEIFGEFSIISAAIGGYWIFDKVNSQLIKLAPDFKPEYRKDLFFDEIINKLIAEDHNHLYFKSETDKVLDFNIGTGNIEYLPFQFSGRFKVSNKKLQYFHKESKMIITYNLSGLDLSKIQLPDTIDIIEAESGNSKIFFNDESKVYIASIKEL